MRESLTLDLAGASMTRHHLLAPLSSYIFVIVVALVAAAATAQVRGATPNFLVIMTDDQAAWALGCYGNRECRTPNMDRLARDGARFRNAFTVTPVCSPSRASFFT